MLSVFQCTKYQLIRQLRTNRFLLIVVISILLGYLCVPAANDNYEIFYLGGVRGIYNSAWLGSMASALSIILLWLPGFYILRSQISEDRRLKIGQIIASTPITKFKYICTVFISNFILLTILELLFIIAMIGMQLLRQEDGSVLLLNYLMPLLIITVPNLIIVAALTVVFDVIPGLKGSVGNILIFVLWTGLSTLSVALPNNKFDLFGIGMILDNMMQSAKTAFPNIGVDGGSFGYNAIKKASATFYYKDIEWNKEFLISRIMWVGIAFVLINISTLIFNRFKENQKGYTTIKPMKHRTPNKKISQTAPTRCKTIQLTPVSRTKYTNLLRITFGDFKIMFTGMSFWWYLVTLTSIVLSFFVSMKSDIRLVALLTLLPFSIWSQMGCLEKNFFTEELILSSCSRYSKWISTWIAGIMISFMISFGILVHFLMLGDTPHFIGWIVGIVFVPTLALVLGSLSGNRKLFEAIYIVWFYFGPLNSMWKSDFLSLVKSNILSYLLLSVVLLGIGLFVQFCKENKIIH